MPLRRPIAFRQYAAIAVVTGLASLSVPAGGCSHTASFLAAIPHAAAYGNSKTEGGTAFTRAYDRSLRESRRPGGR